MNLDFSKLEMRVSRTQQKKAHERLQGLALPLSKLPKKEWENLPVTEYFLDELKQLLTIPTASARNRQIKRIGNLIEEENRFELVDALFEKVFTTAQIAKIDSWRGRLSVSDESNIKQFTKQYTASEFNTLYQLLLWIEYAKFKKDDELLAESVRDLNTYIKEVAILSVA